MAGAGRHVLFAIEHFIDRHAQNAQIHARDALDGPVLRIAADEFVDLRRMRANAFEHLRNVKQVLRVQRAEGFGFFADAFGRVFAANRLEKCIIIATSRAVVLLMCYESWKTVCGKSPESLGAAFVEHVAQKEEQREDQKQQDRAPETDGEKQNRQTPVRQGQAAP